MTRAERIEEAALALTTPSTLEGSALIADFVDKMDALRAALALPVEEPAPRFPATVEGAKALMAFKAEHPEYGAPYPSQNRCRECGKIALDCPHERAYLSRPEEYDPSGPRCQEWSEEGRGQCVRNRGHSQPHDYNSDPSRCWRCGDAAKPGYLILAGKGGALIPCPYCRPGAAVDFLDAATPAPSPSPCPVCTCRWQDYAGTHKHARGCPADSPCPECGGSGRCHMHNNCDERCNFCHGTGRKESK